jgi:hypothetical protein
MGNTRVIGAISFHTAAAFTYCRSWSFGTGSHAPMPKSSTVRSVKSELKARFAPGLPVSGPRRETRISAVVYLIVYPSSAMAPATMGKIILSF